MAIDRYSLTLGIIATLVALAACVATLALTVPH
jgi:hypothetical protein